MRSGLGLREQARALGVSASSLSDLENSRGGMSLTRLQQVADHFGLHITDLLAEVDEAPDGDQAVEVIRTCAASVPGVWRGHGVLYQLLGQAKGHAIQPYLLSFEPGGTFEEDKIAHAGEEFAYVLLGQVEVLIDAEVHRLTESDMVRFRTERAHAFRNPSSTGMAIVIGAATPPW
jgi:quercetin dioxygenase-like cupin family protein